MPFSVAAFYLETLSNLSKQIIEQQIIFYDDGLSASCQPGNLKTLLVPSNIAADKLEVRPSIVVYGNRDQTTLTSWQTSKGWNTINAKTLLENPKAFYYPGLFKIILKFSKTTLKNYFIMKYL